MANGLFTRSGREDDRHIQALVSVVLFDKVDTAEVSCLLMGIFFVAVVGIEVLLPVGILIKGGKGQNTNSVLRLIDGLVMRLAGFHETVAEITALYAKAALFGVVVDSLAITTIRAQAQGGKALGDMRSIGCSENIIIVSVIG